MKRKKVGIALFYLIALLMAGIIVLHQNPGPAADPREEMIKKIVSCGAILAACLIFTKWYDKFVTLPVELFQNRNLIWKLAKNDFKKRYAGSYMGAVWAMVQPVVTVAMYYIVFDKIMGNTVSRGEEGIPFVLFLTAGLVPWFYFSEALNNGTNALLENNYLVKKVVFKISILQNHCGNLYSCIFRGGFIDCGGCLRVLSYCLYPADTLLQLLYVHICTGIMLFYLFYRSIFQGFEPDYQYRAPDWNVGDTDFMGYERNWKSLEYYSEAESAGVYCERVSECHLWTGMVLAGFLFYDVFLDYYGSIVWNRGSLLQAAEGSFCRCFVGTASARIHLRNGG